MTFDIEQMRNNRDAERPCPKCGRTLNGHSALRHFGTYTAHESAYCMRYLRDDRDALAQMLQDATQENERLTAVNAELLDVLEVIADPRNKWNALHYRRAVSAAIAKAKGGDA